MLRTALGGYARALIGTIVTLLLIAWFILACFSPHLAGLVFWVLVGLSGASAIVWAIFVFWCVIFQDWR